MSIRRIAQRMLEMTWATRKKFESLFQRYSAKGWSVGQAPGTDGVVFLFKATRSFAEFEAYVSMRVAVSLVDEDEGGGPEVESEVLDIAAGGSAAIRPGTDKLKSSELKYLLSSFLSVRDELVSVGLGNDEFNGEDTFELSGQSGDVTFSNFDVVPSGGMDVLNDVMRMLTDNANRFFSLAERVLQRRTALGDLDDSDRLEDVLEKLKKAGYQVRDTADEHKFSLVKEGRWQFENFGKMSSSNYLTSISFAGELGEFISVWGTVFIYPVGRNEDVRRYAEFSKKLLVRVEALAAKYGVGTSFDTKKDPDKYILASTLNFNIVSGEVDSELVEKVGVELLSALG